MSHYFIKRDRNETSYNIGTIGFFVFNHTLKTQVKPEPAKLVSLISINREIAAGLRGSAGEEAATPAAGTQMPSDGSTAA